MIKLNTKKKCFSLLIVSIVLLASCCLFVLHSNGVPFSKHLYEAYQQTFWNKEKQVDDILLTLKETKNINSSEKLLSVLESNHIDGNSFFVFVYQDSTIRAWNTNRFRVPQNLRYELLDSIYQVQNQWIYLKNISVENNIYFVGFSLNMLNRDKNNKVFPNPIPLNLTPNTNHFIIVNRCDEPIFGLNFQANNDENTLLAVIILFLTMTAIIFIVYALAGLLNRLAFFNQSPILLFVLASGVLIGLAELLLLKGTFFSQKLFNPLYYSSYKIVSLGELFVLSYFFLNIAILFDNFFTLPTDNTKKYIKIIGTIICLSVIIVFNYLICTIIIDIPQDSIITLQPGMMFQYDILSWVAIMSILFLFWTILITSKKAIYEVYKKVGDTKLFLIASLSSIVGVSFFLIPSQDLADNPFAFLFYLVFIFFFIGLIIIQILKKKNYFWFYLSCILTMSLILFFNVRHSNKDKEKMQEANLVEQIFLQEDPYIKFELQEIVSQIESDSTLKHYLSIDSDGKSNIRNYIFSKYLAGRFDKYNIFINVGNLSNEKERFKITSLKQKYLPSDTISTTSIFSRQRRLGFTEYIIHQPIQTNTYTYTILIVLQNNTFANIAENPNNNFALAVYEKGVLRATVGQGKKPFAPSFAGYHQNLNHSPMQFEYDRINYSAYAKDNYILLFTPTKVSPWQNIAFVEIIVILNLICSFFILFLSAFFNSKIKHLTISISLIFNSFIASFFAIVVVIFMIFFVRFYIMTREEYHEEMLIDNAKEIQRTIFLTIEENNITTLNESALTKINDVVEKLFDAEYLDVNIYDQFGRVVQSYGKGIMTNTIINPTVFQVFIVKNSTKFFKEQENTNYNFIYRAIKDNNNHIIGYTGLLAPKITSFQQVIVKYKYFVSKFIGMGLFIIFAIIILGFSMVRILTKPLQKVTKNLLKIDVENQNFEKIFWDRNDEIGQLVKSYNILQERLQISAEMLERNAQEMAWKEMAKQIAHEIKNPLTPMRLKTQMLLQNIDNIDKTKLKDYMQMILEQIDVLNETASSFSTIARNTTNNAQIENISDLIWDSIHLFDEENHIKFCFTGKYANTKPLALIDKSQFIRVLVNLIKNAIQAQYNDRVLNIDIVLQDYGEHFWQISITDNGKGILPEEKDKIFHPNFTTKTSGSGIGLSVVKNIVFSWGGNISFESKPDEGTTFTFTLPRYEKH